ncbi:MAG: hypothetical protein ACJAYN_000984 [Bermanella sp.]|jgi:hypothetical protein
MPLDYNTQFNKNYSLKIMVLLAAFQYNLMLFVLFIFYRYVLHLLCTCTLLVSHFESLPKQYHKHIRKDPD